MTDQIFYCIVDYIAKTPSYYVGYFESEVFQPEKLRPAVSSDFNEALKCHSQEDAERILRKLNRPNWKVEEHMYHF